MRPINIRTVERTISLGRSVAAAAACRTTFRVVRRYVVRAAGSPRDVIPTPAT